MSGGFCHGQSARFSGVMHWLWNGPLQVVRDSFFLDLIIMPTAHAEHMLEVVAFDMPACVGPQPYNTIRDAKIGRSDHPFFAAYSSPALYRFGACRSATTRLRTNIGGHLEKRHVGSSRWCWDVS